MSKSGIKESRQDKIFLFFNYVFIWFLILIVAYPLFFVLIASISEPNKVASGEVWLWPKGINFDGFQKVFENTDIWIGYRNTIFYTVVGTLVNLIVILTGAYALSRVDFIGSSFIMFMVVFTMFFQGGIIPEYLLVKNLGMVNTVWALIFPKAAAAWDVIISRTFFKSSIPRELEEVAEVDGCDPIRFFFKIVVPLSTPIIAVMALFNAVNHWNEYFDALIYLQSDAIYPLQLFLREILVESQMSVQGGDGTSAAEQARLAGVVKYAVMIVSTLPILLFYPFLQRYFVQGVMIGSIKG